MAADKCVDAVRGHPLAGCNNSERNAILRWTRREAGVVQWQNRSFPSFGRGFDSHRPLQKSRDFAAATARRFGSKVPRSAVSASCFLVELNSKSKCAP